MSPSPDKKKEDNKEKEAAEDNREENEEVAEDNKEENEKVAEESMGKKQVKKMKQFTITTFSAAQSALVTKGCEFKNRFNI